MTTATANRQIRLRQRPDGRIDERTFETVEEAMPEPGAGPGAGAEPLPVDRPHEPRLDRRGADLPAAGRDRRGDARRRPRPRGRPRIRDDYPEGALVTGLVGWQDYTLAGGEGIPLTVVPELELPIECMLGALGITGHHGLVRARGDRQAAGGRDVVVSAAAGAVGSVVGPAREAAGRARRRDRGRRRQVRLAGRRARLRRGGGPPRPATGASSCARPARTASTSTSRTSAARSWTRSSRC